MNTINTLRQLIETGALGINPDTPVTLSYEYGEDVAHYYDDYQDEVFYNSDVASMLLDFLTTGVDKHMLDGVVAAAIADSEYIEHEGYFIDAGTPSSWKTAVSRCILERRFIKGTIQGNSWVESGSVKANNSMIKSGCEVYGKVSDSTLLTGSKVMNGAIVDGCLIGEGSVIGSNAIISDVIVDHGVVVPEGHIQSGGVI